MVMVDIFYIETLFAVLRFCFTAFQMKTTIF